MLLTVTLCAEVVELTEVMASTAALNRVVLRGRVSSEPVTRELPSGAVVVTLRIAMTRERTPMTSGSKQTSDWVDCAAWGSRARRTVLSWHVGDTVEVEGSLRRRFFRGDSGASSRVEVEVLKGRVSARAD